MTYPLPPSTIHLHQHPSTTQKHITIHPHPPPYCIPISTNLTHSFTTPTNINTQPFIHHPTMYYSASHSPTHTPPSIFPTTYPLTIHLPPFHTSSCTSPTTLPRIILHLSYHTSPSISSTTPSHTIQLLTHHIQPITHTITPPCITTYLHIAPISFSPCGTEG